MTQFKLHVEQTWIPYKTEIVTASDNKKYNYTIEAYGETLVTPPSYIAGKRCFMECNTSTYYTNYAPKDAVQRSAVFFTPNLTNSHGQSYLTDGQMTMQVPMSLNYLNNTYLETTGAHLVKIPDGPFPFRIYVRRIDGTNIAASAGVNPTDPDPVPSPGVMSATMTFTPVE